MTPLDRWILQDTREEMWNNVDGVYGGADPVQEFDPPTPLEVGGQAHSSTKDRSHKTGSANWSLEGMADGERGEEKIGYEE